MNLSPRCETTIATQPTFGQMLERLYVEKHTGPVIVHFQHGAPQTVEIPSEPERIRLDNRRARP